MYAGSDAVVASLWNVSDQGTKEFIRYFFEYIVIHNQQPITALHNAKRKMMKQAGYEHPFYWSAFVYFGK